MLIRFSVATDELVLVYLSNCIIIQRELMAPLN